MCTSASCFRQGHVPYKHGHISEPLPGADKAGTPYKQTYLRARECTNQQRNHLNRWRQTIDAPTKPPSDIRRACGAPHLCIHGAGENFAGTLPGCCLYSLGQCAGVLKCPEPQTICLLCFEIVPNFCTESHILLSLCKHRIQAGGLLPQGSSEAVAQCMHSCQLSGPSLVLLWCPSF